MKHIWLFATVLALTGCNDPGIKGVDGVQDALASQVTACTHLTNIQMTPGVYGPVVSDQALRYARNRVMADAKDAGANTVVFETPAPGADIYLIQAKAYRC